MAQQLLEVTLGDERSEAVREKVARKQKEKRGKKKETTRCSTSDNDSDADEGRNNYLRGAQTNPDE